MSPGIISKEWIGQESLRGKQGLKDGREEDADRILLYKDLLYIQEVISIELISQHHNDSWVKYCV